MKSNRLVSSFLRLSLTLFVVGGVLQTSAPAWAKAPVCDQVFVAPQAPNKDYSSASEWGRDLPEQLAAYTPRKVVLQTAFTPQERVQAVAKFLLADLIVAPGHKILRVYESKPATTVPESAESRKVLLNAITDSRGRLRFLDVWDGHHRILSAYQRGLKKISDLQKEGFEIGLLINGKPAGSEEVWNHILPSAASNPSWQNRMQQISGKDLNVSGVYSNYEMGSRTTMAQLALNESHAQKSKIGLFFGTFDPVHEHHIAVAKQAQKEFGLDRVILIPNALPQHKKPTTLGLRQALLIERVKTEKTLDTALFDTNYYIENFGKEGLIEKIRQDLGSNNIFLIDGGDAFQKLLDLNQIVPTPVINYIVIRRGEHVRIPKYLQGKVFESKKDLGEMSSSEVRKAFAEGHVPEAKNMAPPLSQMIQNWGLYQTKNPKLQSSEQIYQQLRSGKPLADLQFKGGAGSERFGLNFHHNDIWQVLVRGKTKSDYQVAFFKPDTSRHDSNRLEMEEVAYRLNRILNMDIVPPTALVASYRVGSKVYERGVVSYAIPGAQKLLGTSHQNHSLEEKLFFSDARILNVLLQNKDASDRNFLIGRHWQTGKTERFVIDFSQSGAKGQYLAMDFYPVGHTEKIEVFRKGTLENLQALSEESLLKNLGALLPSTEIKEILARRDGIVRYIHDLQQKRDSGVLF